MTLFSVMAEATGPLKLWSEPETYIGMVTPLSASREIMMRIDRAKKRQKLEQSICSETVNIHMHPYAAVCVSAYVHAGAYVSQYVM